MEIWKVLCFNLLLSFVLQLVMCNLFLFSVTSFSCLELKITRKSIVLDATYRM